MKTLQKSCLIAVLLPLIGSAQAALIAHWTFDENTGTTATDSSGNGLTATSSLDSWTTGISGSASLNPRFTLADSSSLVLTGQTAYTISLWVNTSTNDDFAILAGFEGQGSTGDRYGLKVSSGNIQLTEGGGPKITSPGTIGTTYSNGSWAHIVGVNDPVGGASYLYVNGAQVATGGVVNIPNPADAQWTMGTYWNSNSFNYTGALDDVQVYDEALSLGDVGLLFANPGTAIPEPSTVLFSALATLLLLMRRRRCS